jgi:prolyl oligopeptidase
VSMQPIFSSAVTATLLHTNGLFCVANIRGGGEFGEEWHKAAVRENRPVAFADFEECGRYLIREGWTRKEKLVCRGGSNGGALIGAVMNRAGEETFAAGVAQVGYVPVARREVDGRVLDLLRYHLFTIGYAWKSDYGDPEVKEDFGFLYKWSPYHNVRHGRQYQYPAVLCETSDHDDRVYPPQLLLTIAFRCIHSSTLPRCNIPPGKLTKRHYYCAIISKRATGRANQLRKSLTKRARDLLL